MNAAPACGETLREREDAVAARYSLFPSPRDRLEEILNSGPRGMELPPEARREQDLVPGCQSRVWLAVSWPERRCAPRAASDSAVVAALARLVCEVYRGATPEEAAAHETTLIARLGLGRVLSPTRLNGLANISARLRSLAAAELARLRAGTQDHDS